MGIWTAKPTLYTKPGLESERVRALLAEKGSPVEVVEVTTAAQEEALSEVNVDGVFPILIDKGLVAYGHALDEYIHERWPGPQLIPTTPMQRAHARMLAGWIKEWYGLNSSEQNDRLLEVEHSYDASNRWFLGTTLSIVDIALMPLLFRRTYAPVTLGFSQYIERLMGQDAFKAAA